MKKILLTTIIAAFSLIFCMNTYSQEKTTETDLITFLESYEDHEGAEYMNLKGLLLSFAKPALKDTPIKNLTDNIENMCVFTMDKPSGDVRKTFLKEMMLVLSGYEKVLETKEDNKESIIYLKRKDDAVISEMAVYSNDGNIAIVVMKGDIPLSDLEEMAGQS